MRLEDVPVGGWFRNAKGVRAQVTGRGPNGTVSLITESGRALEAPPSLEVTAEIEAAPPQVADARLDGNAQLRAAALAEGRKPSERRADVGAILRHLTSEEIEEAAGLALPMWAEAMLREEVQRRTAAQADQRAPASRHLDEIRRLQDAMGAAEMPADRAAAAAELLRAVAVASREEPARIAVWTQAKALATRIATDAAREIAAVAPTVADAARDLEAVVEALVPGPAIDLAPLRTIAPDVDDETLARLAPMLATTATLGAACRLDSGLTADDLDLLARLETGGRARQSAITNLRKAAQSRRVRALEAAAASTSPDPVADVAQVTPEPTAANTGAGEASAQPSEVPTQAPEVPTQPAEVPTQGPTTHVVERPDGYDRWAKFPGQRAELLDEVRVFPDRLTITTAAPGASQRCASIIREALESGRRVEVRGAETADHAPRAPDVPPLDVLLALVRQRAAAAGFSVSISLTPGAA
jgi:hypothetical protein